MTSRLEAAWKIEEALNDAGYCASAWSKGNAVRVYVKDGKKDCGYLAISYEGAVEPCLDRQRGTIMAAIPELQIDPIRIASAQPKTETPDDPMERLEQEANQNVTRDPLELG